MMVNADLARVRGKAVRLARIIHGTAEDAGIAEGKKITRKTHCTDANARFLVVTP